MVPGATAPGTLCDRSPSLRSGTVGLLTRAWGVSHGARRYRSGYSLRSESVAALRYCWVAHTCVGCEPWCPALPLRVLCAIGVRRCAPVLLGCSHVRGV